MMSAVNSQSYEVEIRERTDRQMLLILLAHIPVVGLLVPMGYGTTMFALIASLLVGGLATAGGRGRYHRCSSFGVDGPAAERCVLWQHGIDDLQL